MKLKNIFILFLILLPLSAAGRFIQLSGMTDPFTGFFYENFSGINIFMTVFFTALMLLLFVSTFTFKDYSDNNLRKSPLMTAASFVMALALLIELGSKMVSFDFSAFNLIYFVLLLLSAAVFCINGISNISDIKVNSGLMMIFPLILWIFRLISSFISFTGMANISENVITIIMICASMVFLLSQGKLAGGIISAKNTKLAVSFGMISANLCLISTLPRYILYLIDKTKLHEGAVGSFTDLALAFYAICFIYICLSNDNKIKE